MMLALEPLDNKRILRYNMKVYDARSKGSLGHRFTQLAWHPFSCIDVVHLFE